MQPRQRYTFKKEEKLKSRKAIELLFKEGKTFSNFPFRMVWKFNETAATELQAGFTVSTKQFRKAVDRNRIKRLVREAYRLQKHPLQQHLQARQQKLSIFFIYVGNELPDHATIFNKTGSALRRLLKIVHENSAADT